MQLIKIMFEKSIRVASCSPSCILTAGLFYYWIHHTLSNHSTVEKHLSCSHEHSSTSFTKYMYIFVGHIIYEFLELCWTAKQAICSLLSITASQSLRVVYWWMLLPLWMRGPLHHFLPSPWRSCLCDAVTVLPKLTFNARTQVILLPRTPEKLGCVAS